MSDKDTKAKSRTKTDSADTHTPATTSIAPAMDLSLDAVTVPPPPVAGAAGDGGLSIPRAPKAPQANKPAASPAKPKRSDDDIFSVFDVESNAAPEEVPISVEFDKKPEPPPPPEKPRRQFGSRSGEREVTRSRQIPVDEDLFSLSAGLFSSPDASLSAPDMSALKAPASSDKASSDKPAAPSGLDALVEIGPLAPLVPLDSKALAAPKPAPKEPAKSSTPRSNRMGLILGVAAAAVVIGGVFFFVQQVSTAPEPTASLQPATTSTEAALDTRPGQLPAADEPRTAKPDTPGDEAAAPSKPAPTPGAGNAPKESLDKPVAAGDSVKPAAHGKPSEPEATAKPAEPEAPAGTAKALSLAEAMAAANPGGGAAPPPPPSGPEFNKGAASAALNSAAGIAAGCKAPGDPSGGARVSVTFAPSGRATRALVQGGPYAGTATGGCIANAFKGLSIPPFSGDPVTVSKSVTLR